MGKMTVYLGKDLITKIYDLADVYHSDNIDRVSEDFIEAAGSPMLCWLHTIRLSVIKSMIITAASIMMLHKIF